MAKNLLAAVLFAAAAMAGGCGGTCTQGCYNAYVACQTALIESGAIDMAPCLQQNSACNKACENQ